MKKVYKYLCLVLFSFMLFIDGVFAASYSISTTSNSVTVGNSITLRVNCSNVAGKFNFSSSNSSVLAVSKSTDWIDNTTQSITLTAKKVGTAKITVTPVDVSGYDGSTIKEVKTITITVKAKPVVNNNTGGSSSGGSSTVKPTKPKSSNSYLSSLTVDGYDLDNTFDKESLEYSVTVKEGTEKIKINAQLADSTAKVTGVGEVSVTEGINNFDIVVTAENGSKRTYVLKVNVKEYEPINVKIDGDEYTVIRKKKDLPKISEYFTEKEIKIGDDIVDGYYNENLKYHLVGLKDKFGNIDYYIYEDGKYILYNEQVFNGMVLRILDKEVTGGYKKTNFSYNDSKINSYQEVKLDIIKNTYALDNNDIEGNNFYLFYAINMETGKEELYQYDSVEKTVQRYNSLILDMYKEQSDKYYLYLLCSILVLGVTIITFSTIIICGNKRRKKRMKKNSKKSSKKKIDMEDDF